MNEALFATLHIDAPLANDAALALITELTGGTLRARGVDTAWARITVGDDGGDFESRQREPDDFVHWQSYIEIMPPDAATADAVVPRVADLMTALRGRGIRVVTIADYAEQLPGAGELM
jgi:hypothetical protein